ncbi:unnamed protein product [Caenorhabditis nigoni]
MLTRILVHSAFITWCIDTKREEQAKEARQNAQDTPHSFIKVPIARKDNDKMIDRYAIRMVEAQWCSDGHDIAQWFERCIFCIVCSS